MQHSCNFYPTVRQKDSLNLAATCLNGHYVWKYPLLHSVFTRIFRNEATPFPAIRYKLRSLNLFVMTLLFGIILAAILIIAGIYLVKNTAKRNVSVPDNKPENVSARPTAPAPNPGSIPDKPGTKGDGGSALSSGGQG